MTRSAVQTVIVFGDGPGGGNPAPVVLDARGWSDAQMQAVARDSGHESAFVVDVRGPDRDLALRYWVPNHEMSMCGHATVGAVWLLRHHGLLPESVRDLRIDTRSGPVRARVAADDTVGVSQAPPSVEPVNDADGVLDVLGLERGQLAGPVRNARTSRTKTLVPVADPAVLDALSPAWDRVETACDAVDSTGLYPYARTGDRQFDARQFPRSSGYPEDPATGVAATALAGGLVADGTVTPDGPVVVRQGRAMGRPSRIVVSFDVTSDGTLATCWLTGSVELA